MLHHLKRRFDKGARPFEPTGALMGPCSTDELMAEILSITQAVMRQAGVDLASISVRVERVTMANDRGVVLRSMVDLVRWQPAAAVRLLLGAGHIERATRRAFAESWIAQSCDFAGVWLHPGDAVLESANLRQLSSLLSHCGSGLSTSRESDGPSISAPDRGYAATVPSPLGNT
jgi:hypothetical protein